jgi:outer membrane protein OmpA-like peptidoglycan-associated protein
MTMRLRMTAVALVALATLAGCSSKSSGPMSDTTGGTPSPTGSEIVSPRSNSWDKSVMPDPAPSSTPMYRVNEITFTQGTASYGAEGSGVCRDTANLLKERNVKKILLVAYSDKTEGDNKSLSMQRCDSIRRCMVQHGLAPEMFEMASYGARFAEADRVEPTKMEQERRVEIWVLAE